MDKDHICSQVEVLRDSAVMQQAFVTAREDAEHTLAQQLELVQIPAASNQERERALRFQQMIEAEGFETVIDEVCNVYTVISGTGNGPTIYVSAHLDTVFSPDTPLDIRYDGTRICVPGISDDTRGLAEILALLRLIRKHNLRPVGNLILGGNVGEEGLGDLRGIRHFFQKNADEVDAFYSIDGASPVLCYGGTGSHRYQVVFHGPGGHSFNAFGLVNPIHAMGRAIAHLSEIRTQETPRTTFSVGIVDGGTSINAIPSECSMKVDMRSNCQEALEALDAQLHACVEQGVAEENARWETERTWGQGGMIQFDKDAQVTVEWIQVGNRPAGSQPEGSCIVPVLESAFRAMGVEPDYMDYGSTDSNIPLSLGIPAVTGAGGGTSGNGHSVHEWFDPTDAYVGVQRNLLSIFAMAGLSGVSEPMIPIRKR